MSDVIRYRLPGTKEIVAQQGVFSLLANGETPSGFVISDFLHQRTFVFQSEAGATGTVLHSFPEKPVVISQRDYQIEAQAMLHAFPVCGVEKAVYSRVKSVPFDLQKAEALFAELEKAYSNAFVYLVSSAQFGTWTGATPETLIEVEGAVLKTVALAGTHAAADTSEWTQKEREEHAFVVDAIEETLVRNGCEIFVKEGPHSVVAGPVQHLRTDFVAGAGTAGMWNLAMDLHPTPAVCGTPRMAALDLLVSREMHDRSLYTGIVGVCGEGKSHLFVNLRCAQLQADKAYLYVGGGYTIDSIPDLEWEETENKSRTLLNCIEKL